MATDLVAPRVYVPSMDKHYPLFLSAEQAARVLGLSRPTVMRRIESGVLKAQKSETGVWNVETTSIFSNLGLLTEVRTINV